MPRAQETLGEVFLKNFVRHLLIASYKPGEQTSQIITEANSSKEMLSLGFQPSMQVSSQPTKNVSQLAPTQLIKKPAAIQQSKTFSAKKQIPQMRTNIPQTTQKPIPRALLEYNPSLPSKGQIQSPVNLGKITPLLLDPSVISIECPGPSKNVLVNRAGSIQATGMILAKDEIDKIIEEISDKTRIPVTQGVFKTAFQDLVMTAVVSEFVGTRFIIQKINPFQERY